VSTFTHVSVPGTNSKPAPNDEQTLTYSTGDANTAVQNKVAPAAITVVVSDFIFSTFLFFQKRTSNLSKEMAAPWRYDQKTQFENISMMKARC
jgi:hypothetical protein